MTRSFQCSAGWPEKGFGWNRLRQQDWPGLRSRIRSRQIDLQGKRVTAVCTGHGLKDPDIITRQMSPPPVIPVELAALEEAIQS